MALIARRSGHYKGNARTMQQVIYQLKKVLRVDLSNAKIVGWK